MSSLDSIDVDTYWLRLPEGTQDLPANDACLTREISLSKFLHHHQMLRRARCSYGKSSVRPSVTLCHCGTRRTTKNKSNFQSVIPCIGGQGTGSDSRQ